MKERRLRIEGNNHRYRKELRLIFRLKNRLFYKKKKPQSEEYPFSTIDPFSVFWQKSGYEKFYLVGNNWLDKRSPRPIAVLWGFNDWKFGFVSDYLPEYRTAFASRKFLGIRAINALVKLIEKPSVFVIWGYTESIYVRIYAFLRRIPIIRAEDAFIRSAEFGAYHTTPYSLVFDKVGLYYDPRTRSNIENILNNYDFEKDTELLKKAKNALQKIQYFNISKYNPPELGVSGMAARIKTKKRVAVIGQVDGDASLRYGNPDGWSMEELIHLAKFENPKAEIIYRPHPEVYRGIQKSKLKRKRIESFASISTPDENMSHFLATIDHLYVISSLSGLEALLREKKVTVVGAPFYAGWGLTDDRAKFPRRKTKLTLLELFAGVYLNYPRYLANLDDSYIGLQAACFRITADRDVATYNLALSKDLNILDDVQAVAKSDFWPQLFFSKKSDIASGLVDKTISMMAFNKILKNNPGRLFQSMLLYSICGLIENNVTRNKFITIVRKYIDTDIMNEFLLDLNKYHPGEYVFTHLAWLLNESNESNERSISIGVLSSRIEGHKMGKHQGSEPKHNELLGSEEQDSVLHSIDCREEIYERERREVLLNAMDNLVIHKKFNEAIKLANKLLILGYASPKLLRKMAKIAELKFDMSSARDIANFAQKIDIYGQKSLASSLVAMNSSVTSTQSSQYKFLRMLAMLVRLKPESLITAIFLIKKYAEHFDVVNIIEILYGMLSMDNEQSLQKAIGLISINKAEDAVKVLENIIEQGDSSDSVHILYSQSLSYIGDYDKASLVMDAARKKQETSANYRESMRLYILRGAYREALDLLIDAKRKKIEIGDMLPRKIFFGRRMVKDAFETFTKIKLKKTVATYYKEKYYNMSDYASKGDKLIALSVFGPGDEIRFASIYNLITNYLQQEDITITCDPRLLSLFSCSFPSLRFIPVSRPRSLEFLDMNNYDKVLGSDLTGVIDNTATDAINDADQVMLVTDMLHRCLPSYEAFHGSAYLRYDSDRAKSYAKQLPRNTLLVGLSWRSSLTTHSRNEHYLSIQELEPIFNISGVTFVNLQYDECDTELEWVQERYPNKLINLKEIDQYSDFDGVAALMKCLDLIIAPAITVVELAGALGCPTWLLSNSTELHWRKIDEQGTDVWHNSITHVEGSLLGDKESLVNALNNKLTEYVDNVQNISSAVAV